MEAAVAQPGRAPDSYGLHISTEVEGNPEVPGSNPGGGIVLTINEEPIYYL